MRTRNTLYASAFAALSALGCDGKLETGVQKDSRGLIVNVCDPADVALPPCAHTGADIVAALARIATASPSGGTVRVPAGVYDFGLLSIDVKSYAQNITIECESTSVTFIRRVFQQTGNWEQQKTALFNADESNGFQVKNCRFEFNVGAGVPSDFDFGGHEMISLRKGARDAEVSGNRFEQTGVPLRSRDRLFAVVGDGARDIRVSDNQSGRFEYRFTTSSAYPAQSNLAFTDNLVEDSPGFAISVVGSGTTHSLRNVVIARNHLGPISGTGAIWVGGENGQLLAENSFVQIAENLISGIWNPGNLATGVGGAQGIVLVPATSSANWTITDNKVVNEGPEVAAASGIRILPQGTLGVQRLTIKGNSLGGGVSGAAFGRAALSIESRVSDFVISDNIIAGGLGGLRLEVPDGATSSNGIINGNIVRSRAIGVELALGRNTSGTTGSGVLQFVTISDNVIVAGTNFDDVRITDAAITSTLDVLFANNLLSGGAWGGNIPTVVRCIGNLPRNCTPGRQQKLDSLFTSTCGGATCSVGNVCVSIGLRPVCMQLTGGWARCVRIPDGGLRCWGDGSNGETGLNVALVGDDEHPAVMPNPNVGGPVSMVSSLGFTCELLVDGQVRCHGSNAYGQLGYGDTMSRGLSSSPGTYPTLNLGGSATQISVGESHACALMANNTVKCWGRNQRGQLGYGHTNNIGDDPGDNLASLQVNLGTTATVKRLYTGHDHSCAVFEAGNIRCWGLFQGNGYKAGDVGDDETAGALGDVITGGPVRQLALGQYHSCALLTDGRVRCWGSGNYGQLGYGNTDSYGLYSTNDTMPPPDVSIGGRAIQIAAGFHHTCALLESGAVRCWGRGDFGQLGYGNTQWIGDNELPSTVTPVQVGGTVAQLVAGNYMTCVLLADANVRCWGNGANLPGYSSLNTIGDNETPASAGNIQYWPSIVDCGSTVANVPCDDGNGCTVGDMCSAGVCTGAANPVCQLVPRVSCADQTQGQLRAWMAYSNPTASAVTVPLGSENNLSPLPMSGTPPTVFAPGVHETAFLVTMATGTDVTWTLGDGSVSTIGAPPCCGQGVPPGPPVGTVISASTWEAAAPGAACEQTWREGTAGAEAAYAIDDGDTVGMQGWAACSGGQGRALKFDADNPTPRRSSWFSLIPVTEGQTYCITSWINWVGGNRPYLDVLRFDDKMTPVGTHLPVFGPSVADGLGGTSVLVADLAGFQRYSKSFVVPMGTRFIQLENGVSSEAVKPPPSVSYFDNVTVVQNASGCVL
jgi:alpha-tubulin suppressor-like RCC1 family protein